MSSWVVTKKGSAKLNWQKPVAKSILATMPDKLLSPKIKNKNKAKKIIL
jgi:hypothetical protein